MMDAVPLLLLTMLLTRFSGLVTHWHNKVHDAFVAFLVWSLVHQEPVVREASDDGHSTKKV